MLPSSESRTTSQIDWKSDRHDRWGLAVLRISKGLDADRRALKGKSATESQSHAGGT